MSLYIFDIAECNLFLKQSEFKGGGFSLETFFFEMWKKLSTTYMQLFTTVSNANENFLKTSVSDNSKL